MDPANRGAQLVPRWPREKNRTSITNPAGVAAILPQQVRRVHLEMTKWSFVRCLVYKYPSQQSSSLPHSVRKNCPWESAMVTQSFLKTDIFGDS